MPPLDFDDAERFPFGKPVNRKESPDMTPIEGRPNWFRDRDGREVYVEPPKPPPDPTAWIQEFLTHHCTAGRKDMR